MPAADRKAPSHRRARRAAPDDEQAAASGVEASDAELTEEDDLTEEEDLAEEPAPRRRRRPKPRRLSATDVAQVAERYLAELTGKQTLGVVFVERNDEGWAVGVEVLEDRRIPSSADILALYRAEIDMDGELLSYGRMQQYMRGRADGAGGR